MSDPHIPLSTITVAAESGVLLARRRAWLIAERLGFEARDQAHIAMAVTEIAYQALKLVGGGKVEFWLESKIPQPMLLVRIYSKSPWMADPTGLTEDRAVVNNHPAVGISSARKWMDHFDIKSNPGNGMIVELGKNLPRRAQQVTAPDFAGEPAQIPPENSMQEILHLDGEILRAADELAGLSRELQDTNRGVVALYAELEANAERLREAQAAVAAAAQQWQTTFDAIGDGIALLDTEGKILRCNQAFTVLAGKSEAAAEDQGSSEPVVRTPDYIVNCLNVVRLSLHREATEIKLPDGRWLNVAVDPLFGESGRTTGYVSVNQDITQRKLAENELQSYAARLERSNRELQDFANIASHDLQEPLRKVRSFGDLLKQKMSPRLNGQELDYLERMQNAAARMQGMIEDLLAYARVTTRAQPRRPVDLNKVVAEVLSDLEVRVIQTNGRVEVANLPVIEADPLQMHQLFQNLIGNALKFHQKGVPPVVKVQSKPIAGNRVEITVEDNGIGFSMENYGFLFQPFRRLHGRSEFEGSGMGLSICRKIVESHGGKISALSEPNKGSTFTVVLPV